MVAATDQWQPPHLRQGWNSSAYFRSDPWQRIAQGGASAPSHKIGGVDAIVNEVVTFSPACYLVRVQGGLLWFAAKGTKAN